MAGSLLSLLILVLGGVLEPDGEVWLSYAFFLLGTAVFITLFLLLSTGISALARSSASSLVLLVTAWTVLMVVIPQTSYLAAVTAVKSPGGTWQQIDTHEREVRTALQREGGRAAAPRSWPGPTTSPWRSATRSASRRWRRARTAFAWRRWTRRSGSSRWPGP